MDDAAGCAGYIVNRLVGGKGLPDGKTMIIRSVIRKAGIIITEISEQFSKEE